MAKPKLDINKLAEYRHNLGLNQHAFWSSLGVTQSGGSRYETGRGIPKPTAVLLMLRESGKISQADIDKAVEAIKKAKGK